MPSFDEIHVMISFPPPSWDTAAAHFGEALTIVQNSNTQTLADKWEPLLNNLGHVYRKLK